MLKFVFFTVVIVLIIQCGSITDSDYENNSNVMYKYAEEESLGNIPSFKEVIATSSLIVDAVVKDITYSFEPPYDYIGYALITLSVLEVIKGECSEEILLRRWGVNKKLEFIEIENIPVYFIDKRYILCLLKNSSNLKEYYYVNGLYNAVFEIKFGHVAGSYIARESFEQRIKDGLYIEDFKHEIKRFMNSVKTIEFDIPESSYGTIIIYNMYGQEIEILRDYSYISSGKRRFIWDGTPYASGIYICRLKSKDFTKEVKVTLLK